MANIKYVLNFCIDLLNTRLSFSPFSFTIYQYFLAMLVMAVVVSFVLKIIGQEFLSWVIY